MPTSITRALPIVSAWARAAHRLRGENGKNQHISQEIKQTLNRIETAARSHNWGSHSAFNAERIWNKLHHALNKVEQKPSGAFFANPKQFFGGNTETRDSLRAKRILTECENIARDLEACLGQVSRLGHDQRALVDHCNQLLQQCLVRVRSLESVLDKETPTLKRRNLLATFIFVGLCMIGLAAVIAGPPGYGIITGAAFASLLVSSNIGGTGLGLWLQWRPQKCPPWDMLKNAVATFEQECDRMVHEMQRDVATFQSAAEQHRHDQQLAVLQRRYEQQLADLDETALYQGMAMGHLPPNLLRTHSSPGQLLLASSQQATAALAPINEGADTGKTDQQGTVEKERRISAPTSSREVSDAYQHIAKRVGARARMSTLSPSGNGGMTDRFSATRRHLAASIPEASALVDPGIAPDVKVTRL